MTPEGRHTVHVIRNNMQFKNYILIGNTSLTELYQSSHQFEFYNLRDQKLTFKLFSVYKMSYKNFDMVFQ